MTDSTSARVPNIGAHGISQRRRSGVIALGVAALLAAGLLVLDAPRAVRLVVFLPLLSAGLGLFQASEKTWVRLASRGLRDMDDGERPVTEEGERTRMRGQARRVWAKTLAFAAVLTAALWIAPV